jgi:formate dehydrogenase iron-sulfur subunit
MIAEARKRIAEKPGEYFKGIYGLQEAGGTSAFFLSAVPFEQLGLRTDLPKHALPPLTGAALSYVPDVVSVGTVLLGGIYWITHRREQVARAERPKRTAREVAKSNGKVEAAECEEVRR